MSGLMRSEYMDSPAGEPVKIEAFSDRIEITFSTPESDSEVVVLKPKHIDSIAAMKDDWWEQWWAAAHEQEA